MLQEEVRKFGFGADTGMAPASVRALALRTRNRLLGGAKPPIAAELRRKLVAIYRQDVESLQELLQRDLSAWLAE